MPRAADWLTAGVAMRRIVELMTPLAPIELPLLDAVGLVLAEDVVSAVAHPPWDNSAMDGFAARAADVRAASETAPVTLQVIEEVPAGAVPSRELRRGVAARVMTGAPIPAGADTVIRLEHTDLAGTSGGEPPYAVRILRADDAGRNVRRAGEDITPGARVVTAGRRLRAAEIGVLAAIGRTRVGVHPAPRVAVLSNGDELVAPDALDELVSGRRIADSNSYALAAALRGAGCVPVPLGIAADADTAIAAAVERGLDCDVLITTAGASVGDHDRMKDVLERLGFRFDFWRVRMRPGSPLSFGLLERERAAPIYVFGLPGNPVSALVTFEVMAKPGLRRLLGREDVFPATVRVRLAERVDSRRGMTQFLRVRIETRAGEVVARLTGPQGSGMLSSMVAADALLIVPESAESLAAGDVAEAIPLLSADPGTAEIPAALAEQP
ncbi:MAG: molybdopterin molybdotransferase MoeA [Longimicrobiales bacterium]